VIHTGGSHIAVIGCVAAAHHDAKESIHPSATAFDRGYTGQSSTSASDLIATGVIVTCSGLPTPLASMTRFIGWRDGSEFKLPEPCIPDILELNESLLRSDVMSRFPDPPARVPVPPMVYVAEKTV